MKFKVMFRSSNPRGRGFDSQPEGLGVAFFATGPGLGLIMYILTTLEFLNITLDFIYIYYILANLACT